MPNHKRHRISPEVKEQILRRVNAPVSGYKVLVEEGSGRLLGAHLLGPHADEVINVFALALHAGLPAGELKGVLFGYPTGASDAAYMV